MKKLQAKRQPQNKARPSDPTGREKPKPRPASERDSVRPQRSGDSKRPQKSGEAGRNGPRPQRSGEAGREGPRPQRSGETGREGPRPQRAPEVSHEGQKAPRSSETGREDQRPQRSAEAGRAVQKARRSHQTGREGLFINNWSALAEYLRAQPGALNKIYHAPREAKRLHQILAEHGVTLACEEDQEMETGFAASVTLQYKNEEDLLSEAAARSEDLIIACDHVTDTRNLGAIARTAAFFGLSTILMPKDRQAPITSATLGTAQGAFATVSPTEVTNLGRTLMALKDCGYWIAAADMVGNPVDKLPTRYEKLVLVLGSEDKGVSAQILNKSDFTLSIPSFGGNLESLNVSVAAGILIHALRAQSAQGKILPEG
ncbi:MAG TPA: TrmH family RNA methyltransferase [Oligoflexus sp.]|uniref:RNA methyltransferase n=1 Tax=Oligoflexus sp. TaxID=1971216 RepID=UPI002D425A16|nr:TrmH family RNA methyltransferase [Oligoflexus sp.]HYX36957.1 TrmH family RNA methyltransferase [Oligoflexus sp.]